MPYYKEHAPPAALSPFVECFWELKGSVGSGDKKQQVLVPGGRAEIIFSNTPFYWYGDNKDAEPAVVKEWFLLGPRTTVNYAGMQQDYYCVGVRLTIGSLQLFTHVAANVFANGITPLVDIVEASCVPNIANRMKQGDSEQLLASISNWLTKRLLPAGPEWYQMRDFLSNLLVQTEKLPDIKSIAEQSGWNYKKAERVFLKYVGLSPRALVRMMRFRQALEKIKSNPGSLTEAAYQFGFYDQSHFIREFHHYAGSNPSSFYKDIPDIAALLYKLRD
jgi:AraC-like DNA-binding protein